MEFSSEATIDVDVEEVFDEMSDREREEMFDLLLEDMDDFGYVKESEIDGLCDENWNNKMDMLKGLYYRLEDNEIEFIENILGNYILFGTR